MDAVKKRDLPLRRVSPASLDLTRSRGDAEVAAMHLRASASPREISDVGGRGRCGLARGRTRAQYLRAEPRFAISYPTFDDDAQNLPPRLRPGRPPRRRLRAARGRAGRAKHRLPAHGGRANRDSIAAFFPRAGGWTWAQTLLHAPPERALAVRRFPAAATRAAIGAGGEACWQFEQMHGGMGQPETYFSMQVRMNGTAWRRVHGSRFVPPGEGADAPTFVEWRREDGRWAVSAIGDVGFYDGPRLLGRPAWERMLDTITLLPPSPVYAAGERWYVNNEPFTFAGRRYIKYGLPRRVEPGQLRRVGRFGMMGIYADPAWPPRRRLDFIYVPTAPGEYQVYQVPETMPDCGG